MQQISLILNTFELPKSQSEYKNKRDELLNLMLTEINRLREGTKYKPETMKMLCIRIARNPFLKDDGELELLYKECNQKKNYSKFYWITK